MTDTPHTETPNEFAALKPPALALERYRHHLKDSDLTQEEADALLEALWNIMVQFVDLGLDPCSVHRYIGLQTDFAGAAGLDSVSSNHPDKNLPTE